MQEESSTKGFTFVVSTLKHMEIVQYLYLESLGLSTLYDT